jgi:hypothetical protein
LDRGTKRPGDQPRWLTLGDIDKCKSTWVIKTTSTKSSRRTIASWHLAEAGHASAWEMQIVSVESRRKAKVSSLAEVAHASTSVSHAW